MKTIILGAGLAGLSTAYHLKNDYDIFEKEASPGGLCRSVEENGFTFDYTGHLLHLSNNYTKRLVKKLLKKNLELIKRSSWVFSKGIYTRYPFQANTYGLPKEVIKECLLGLIEAKYETNKKIANFEDWIIKVFGKGIAKHFMFPYNEKLWRRHPRELTTEWLSRFVPRPNLEEFINGALNIQNKDFGYNVFFWYPRKGGIQSLADALASRVKPIKFKKEAVKIILKKKKIVFGNGLEKEFDILISTIPLPTLISLVKDASEEIKTLAKKLNWVSVLNVNLGVDRKITDKHWVYFPERDFIFYRVGFSSNFSPSLAPPKSTSIYTELSYSASKSSGARRKAIEKRVIRDLIKAGILKREDKIGVIKTLDIPFAYVVYDKNWRTCTAAIHRYLQKQKIYSIGRYGRWKYSTMEEAILEGKEIAQKINAN